MSKHTPGHFHFQKEVDGSDNVFHGIFTDAIEPSPGDFKWVLTPVLAHHLSEGDAQLFSAAPELLEAAHAAFALIKGSGFTDNTRALVLLRDAISKAESK